MTGTALLPPLARLLMSSLFILDGIVQLRNPGGTAQYFDSVHVPAPAIAVLDLDTRPSARRLGAARGFLQPLGRCSACPYLPGHGFWGAPTGRRSEQHDPVLQEPGN